MIPSNIIHRVFYLKSPQSNKIGTCFTLDIENKQYFVTAKHIIEDLKDEEKICLFYKNKWEEYEISLIGHSKVSDISVFAIKSMLLTAPPITGTIAKMVYG